jgi:hypothetical protein
LSTVVEQRPAHGLAFGVQQVPVFGSQTPPPAHIPFTPQLTLWLQLSRV